MSTELVIVPAFPLVAIGGVAVAGVGVVAVGGAIAIGGTAVLAGRAALGVKLLIDRQVEKAHRQMEEERARNLELRRLQDLEHEAMAALTRSREAVRDAQTQLAALTLGHRVEERPSADATAESFVRDTSAAAALQQALSVLLEVEEILDSLPAELATDKDTTFGRLKMQGERLRQNLETKANPGLEPVLAHRDTVRRTIDSYLNRLEQMQKSQNVLAQKAEVLLGEVVSYHHLADTTAHQDDLAVLRQTLLGMPANSVTPGDIDLVARKFALIKAAVDASLHGTVLRFWMAKRMTEHLTAMGYQLVEPFAPVTGAAATQALWRVPGGALGRIALHPNHQIAFQLCRETKDGKEATVDDSEQAFLRQQESVWCGDLQELIRRLSRDGVPYQAQFERFLPEASIPVVVVETADELFDDEEDTTDEWDEPHERYLT